MHVYMYIYSQRHTHTPKKVLKIKKIKEINFNQHTNISLNKISFLNPFEKIQPIQNKKLGQEKSSYQIQTSSPSPTVWFHSLQQQAAQEMALLYSAGSGVQQ